MGSVDMMDSDSQLRLCLESSPPPPKAVLQVGSMKLSCFLSWDEGEEGAWEASKV